MTYREFTDWAKDAVRKIGESFTEPDDDWEPTALIEGGEGTIVVALAMEKALWPSAVAIMAQKTKATKVALVTSSWGLHFSSSEEYDAYCADPDALSPSKHPNGIEMVAVTIYDAERVEAWSARILRDGEQPPSLSEWEWGGAEPDGRMVGPIREAMR